LRVDIIHGDIKPHNVLIFRDGDGFISKLADFGYSHRYANPTDSYCLPLSKPWQAPEVDGSDKEFSLPQAKAADIYSYALLCAWVLYKVQFLDRSIDEKPLIHLESSNREESKWIERLEILKSDQKLEQVVLACVDHDTGLEEAGSKALKELFQTVFGEGRHASQKIWECFKLLEK